MADLNEIKGCVTAYAGFFDKDGKVLVTDSGNLEGAYWSSPVWAVSNMGNIYNALGDHEGLKNTMAAISKKFPGKEFVARPMYFGWGEDIKTD